MVFAFLGFKMTNAHEPFFEHLFNKKTSPRKPFHGLIFPAINKLLPERYFVNQLSWNCTKTVFGKLRRRLKTSINFFRSNIYHFNGCSLAFSHKAVTNFCTCSGAENINGLYQYCFRVENYLDHTGFMITEVLWSLTVVLTGYLCAVSVSVLVVQREEKTWRKQLSQWLPKIFT